ncbi:Rrf2 family transcriptional regulator [Massilia sp. HP4]|uniref:Rrf2 family transcriptional regulator n=1 Tax=Massilia sp. HP4 TaxID=2562316 RepID=UPI0010C0A661|nr:Rrf2 family transcriptional regulator [Massilia sp. HP4]
MRLTSFTDYTLRVLLHLAANDGTQFTIQEMADLHRISKNHLMKVVCALGQAGFVETVRGRKGGFRLGRPAAGIRIGEVVRVAEADFHMAECFGSGGSNCAMGPACGLKHVLARATDAYLDELDRHTLASLLTASAQFAPPIAPQRIIHLLPISQER